MKICSRFRESLLCLTSIAVLDGGVVDERGRFSGLAAEVGREQNLLARIPSPAGVALPAAAWIVRLGGEVGGQLLDLGAQLELGEPVAGKVARLRQ